MNPNCSKPFSFVCSHMVGDDCQTWKALVVLTDMYKSILHCDSKQPFFCMSGENWDNSNTEPCCCYIILYCETAIQSAYSLTSRRALQAWGCVCVPGSGSTLRRAGLKPEHSLWEDCITATQGFPTTFDRDLPLCAGVCDSLHILRHIHINFTHMHTQGSSITHNRSYFYLQFVRWCKVICGTLSGYHLQSRARHEVQAPELQGSKKGRNQTLYRVGV